MGDPDPEMMSETPRTKLERIADAMLEAIPQDVEGLKVIVLVRDEDSGAACGHGYEGEMQVAEMLSDILGAAGMLGEAGGIKMHVFPMGGGHG